MSKPFSDQLVQVCVVKSDIDQVLNLFSVMQNIQMHGAIQENTYREWVSVEQIYWAMPKPKLQKDKLRDFCEYQAEQGNLKKRTGRDKFTRQAKAEYKVSEQGLKTIASYHDPDFKNIKNMITWKPKTKMKSDITDESANES